MSNPTETNPTIVPAAAYRLVVIRVTENGEEPTQYNLSTITEAGAVLQFERFQPSRGGIDGRVHVRLFGPQGYITAKSLDATAPEAHGPVCPDCGAQGAEVTRTHDQGGGYTCCERCGAGDLELTERQRMGLWLESNYDAVPALQAWHLFAGFYVDYSGTNNSGTGLDVLESSSGRMDEAGILCHCKDLRTLVRYLTVTLPENLVAEGWTMDVLRAMKPHEIHPALRLTELAQLELLELEDGLHATLAEDLDRNGYVEVDQRSMRAEGIPDIVRVDARAGTIHYADGTFVGGSSENPH